MSVEVLFEDTEGLVDALKDRPNCRIKYNPQPRANQANSRWISIGSKLPFAEIKSTLAEALTRYNKLQYYSVSNDFYLSDFYREFEIGIGFDTKGAKDRGLRPIESSEMLEALETYESTDQLLTYIRAHYQGEFNTFDIEPITVTSYHSATVGAVEPPVSSQGKISGSEYLATTSNPELYGLTIRMYVDTLEEFLEQFPEVGPMFQEWIVNRGKAAKDFAVCVNAEEPLHKSISNYVAKAYTEGTAFVGAPQGLRISVVVANRANDARTVDELTST